MVSWLSMLYKIDDQLVDVKEIYLQSGSRLAKCRQIRIFAMSVLFMGKYQPLPANMIYHPGIFTKHLDG